MYLVNQAKLESNRDSEFSKYLNLGDWLGVEAENDGRVSVWADINSSFFGLKRKVREQLGFLPSEIANILNTSIKSGRRVRARLIDMQKHFNTDAKNKTTLAAPPILEFLKLSTTQLILKPLQLGFLKLSLPTASPSAPSNPPPQ